MQRAACQELAGQIVALRDIISARNRRRRELRQTLQDRLYVVRKGEDAEMAARRIQTRVRQP
jgi:hypothetical protein